MASQAAVWWWIAAGALVALEIAVGTFYLLMFALGLAAAALVAHAGLGLAAQIVTAAVAGGAAVVLLRQRRARRPALPRPEANRDVLLDVGSRVRVEHWRADGTARVHYRGSDWNARFVGEGVPLPGDHVIRAFDGNELLLAR